MILTDCSGMAARSVHLLTAILLISVLARAVTGAILLYQVEVNGQGTGTWPVEGVATYVHGGLSVRHFLFRCTSTSNNNEGLSWSRKNGVLHKTQANGDNGVDLDFGTNPSATDAGVYVCQDTNDRAELNITDMNPAANPAHTDIQAVIGETVVIEFYASSLPLTQAGNYTWWHNDVPITSGNFQNQKRRLEISNAQESHSGEYRFRVLLRFSASLQLSALTSTHLVVAAAPRIMQGLSSVTMATEWTTVTLVCNISSTFGFTVNWGRVGGVIPPGNTVALTNEGQASITIPAVRLTAKGTYYCNVSYVSSVSSVTYWNISYTDLRVSPVLRLQHNNLPVVNQLLYKSNGSSFTVECLGSDALKWQRADGTDVSLSTSSLVYQSTELSQSKQTLHFNSFQSVSNGVYVCRSNTSVSESVLITNANPIVFAPVAHIQVALNTVAELQVYTSGTNPVPTADHISWYKDGVVISPLSPSHQYNMSTDRMQLNISVTGKDVAGIYESRVTTPQGTSSAFINVTFPDPPLVRVEPPTQTVLAGTRVTYQCIANGTLPHTVQWRFGTTSNLPAGVSVQEDILVINSTDRSHAGTYVCVVSDKINMVMRNAILQVKYPPTAGVGFTPQISQPTLKISYDESQTPHTFSCSSDGYPIPSLTWQFNGGALPDGVRVTQVDLMDGTHYKQLQWSRDLTYRDIGAYMCVAENELNISTAVLNIIVTDKARISTIYPSPDTQLTVDTRSSSLTFLQPRNATTSTLTCVSRGLPSPKMEWRASNGTKLTNSFVTHLEGVVSAVYMWRGLPPVGVVECVAFNETVMDKQTVWISVSDAVISMTGSPPTPADVLQINIVLRILNYAPCSNRDTSARSLLEEAVSQVISHIIISRCQQCQNSTHSVTVDSGSFCSTDVAGAAIVRGHIRTQEAALTQRVFQTLEEWQLTGPVVFVNGSWVAVDRQCSLLASDSGQECARVLPTTSVLPTESFLNTVTFYVVIGTTGFVLIVVLITIVLVTACWAVNRKKHHAVATLAYSDKNMKHSCSGSGQLYTPTADSPVSQMVFNEEYVMSNSLRSTLQRHSRNMDNRPTAMEVNELFFKRHPSEQRVLSTTPPEGVDSPSPTFTSQTFHTPITTQQHQLQASQQSLRSIPLNEILYDPMPGAQEVEHTYDQVHQNVKSHSHHDSHVSVRHNHASMTLPHMRYTRSAAAEIPPYATTPMNSVGKQPEPYQQPETTRLSDSPQFPMRGSSLGISAAARINITTPPPSYPQVYPQPYQEPSTQSRKSSLATLTSLNSTGRLPKSSLSTSRDFIRSTHTSNTYLDDDRLTVAGSDASSSQAWYNNFADSEAGVPASVPPAQHEITPYASIRNSQIHADPYQQPVWTNSSQFSIRSSSNTHIETVQV